MIDGDINGPKMNDQSPESATAALRSDDDATSPSTATGSAAIKGSGDDGAKNDGAASRSVMKSGPMNRRKFLTIAGAGAVGLASAGIVGS